MTSLFPPTSNFSFNQNNDIPPEVARNFMPKNVKQLEFNANVYKSSPLSPTMTTVLLDELIRIRKTLPPSWDEGARLFALAFPIVETAALNCGYFGIAIQEEKKNSCGRPPLSRVALLVIELFAHLYFFGSYRNTPAVLNTHPTWLKALHLEKSPDHTTLCSFRKELGTTFFVAFFKQVTQIMIAFEILSPDIQLIVDSAPIHASMNFARANRMPALDEERVLHFFQSLDWGSVQKNFIPVSTGKKQKGKRKYPIQGLLGTLMLEILGGFLSRSQVIRYLQKHDNIARCLGFNEGVPPDSTFTGFLKNRPAVEILLQPMLPHLQSFFSEIPEIANSLDLNFFTGCFVKDNPVLMKMLA